ncbi:GntR family transcriptional regulator [Salinispora vitiensis]|uniref:GntR family transcriptional regulator n=1 Tax=Salinispora vitiensis TaxID=999544 RepID=UPI0009B772D5|nr:GntR family transcriptional regulator [Salinispora vitiensis]
MQPDRTLGTVPLHDQIADDLRARIASGEYAPGQSLPSVRQLQERWGCADGTVREAIAILLGEGRITSSRGARARVRIPPTRSELAISISPEAAQTQKDLALKSEEERAATGAVELALGMPINQTRFTATYSRVQADHELATEFDVKVGTELLRRSYRTVNRDSGRLVLSSVSHVPVALVEQNPELLDEKNEPWPGGHWHQLHTVGIEIDRLDNSIIALQPTTRQRQDWGMDPGVPLLCLRSRSVDTLGRVVEVADSTYPADRTAVRYSHQLKRWE